MSNEERHQQSGGNYLRIDLGGSTIALLVGLVIALIGASVLVGIDIAERQRAIEQRAEERVAQEQQIASYQHQLAELQATEQKRERETRMLEYYVMEVDGKLAHAGIVRPSQIWSARKRKETKP